MITVTSLRIQTLICCLAWPVVGEAQTLQARLGAESEAELAAAAQVEGNARRGAILFYQPFMSCRKCHTPDDTGHQLGPDLARWDKPASDAELVQAILQPSASIRKGFESLTIVTPRGKTVVGLIVKNDDEIVLRDPSQPGRLHEFPRAELEAIVQNKNSLMPEGLVNQLSSRQQFLDLVRYLIEVRDGGPKRARDLEPAPHLYAAPPLPEYEQAIDHAGLIADLGPDNFERGAAIYNRLCVNCHGTHQKPGSLPTSLRFASGQFKNGSDPYTMYQTLTRGFGMMQPQAWMVPQQKYDVIHYIREAYLKEDNPSQYFAVDDQWLAALPAGELRGPRPQALEPWLTMDYGRTLINTYEVGSDASNFAYKGIAMRLDPGPGGVSRGQHWMIFDHDTLRMSAVWQGTGFIDWNGIHFNGKHAIHPRVVGTVQAQNPTGPGWAEPQSESWTDPRIKGRDGRRYGPLPREWAHYQGLFYDGNDTVVAYTVGETEIRESPQLISASPSPVYARRFAVGPHMRPLTLQVAQLDQAVQQLPLPDGQRKQSVVLFGPEDLGVPRASKRRLEFDGETFAQVDDAEEFDLTRQNFTISSRVKTKTGGTLFAKTDPGEEWVPDGKALFIRGGRVCFDIGWIGVVQSKRKVSDGRWHTVAVTWDHERGLARLFVDGAPDAQKVLRPKKTRTGHVVRIGFAAPNFPRPHSFFQGDMAWLKFHDSELSAAQLMGDKAEPKPRAAWEFPASRDIVRNTAADQYHARIRRGRGESPQKPYFLAGLETPQEGLDWQFHQGAVRLTIPPADEMLNLSVWFAALQTPDETEEIIATAHAASAEARDLQSLTDGGPARWPEVIETEATIGEDSEPFAVDVLTRPETNPWLARVRLTGFDFFEDGDTAAVCAWDGDVWEVSGVDRLDAPLKWRRVASGLFQPLGLRIVDGDIYVTCRDQIVILRDLNSDGEFDFYENFNNDHQVTDHFHEFAMGLQTDEEGNFYYAKSARHALPALVPHHGTLLRVSRDGSQTEILANGFRAANGVCLNSDGSFIVTDQEGHWNPKNRINWVREGGFYGNMFGYHDVTDSSDDAMAPPLCWITNSFDRSPAELLWVPEDAWGPLGGSLLNLSYGYGKVFVVPHEEIRGQKQGGMCELPLPQFPTGLVRGRFHPQNGHLYTCGMFAWAGNQQQPGGFYRIRATGKPMHLPVGLHAGQEGIQLEFTDALDRASAEDPENYSLSAWDLKRTAKYGSDHYNEREWPVSRAILSEDGKTVRLTVPEIEPTWGMEIRCFLQTPDGQPVERRIHNTIHHLGE